MKHADGRYLAVIGDIKDSGDLENIGEIQRQLKAVLDQINLHCRSEIVSEFLNTLGDEFQGRMKMSAPVPETLGVSKTGTIERLIMLLFISPGQYTAMGVVLTSKPIAGYDRISRDQEFAEYYLPGTLLSTACVVLCKFFILP